MVKLQTDAEAYAACSVKKMEIHVVARTGVVYAYVYPIIPLVDVSCTDRDGIALNLTYGSVVYHIGIVIEAILDVTIMHIDSS